MSTSNPPSFTALGLRAELLRAVELAGFHSPTSVQAAVFSSVLAGHDVLVRAATGSGKTAAFALPILQRLLDHPRPHGNRVTVLVLAPTRELVRQIGDVLTSFARGLSTHIKILTVYGGVAINPQMMALRGGADILIATPGRVLDLHQHNAIDFAGLGALVLDEADRLLGESFHEELASVLTVLPEQRQNVLVAATWSSEHSVATRTWLHAPLEVDLTRDAKAADPEIEEHVYTVDLERKAELLIQLLKQRELSQVLVFISMKRTADSLVTQLNRAGIRAAVFHADKSQHERTQRLSDFRSGKLRVLLATDLAARGIDIDDLPVVINFELPRSPNDYVHRIGRTGRAGKTGLAISLICRAEEQHFRVIEKRIKRRLAREFVEGFAPQTNE